MGRVNRYDLLRRLCGLSHPEAARLLGVSVDASKSWGAGRYNPPEWALEMLRRLWEDAQELADTLLDRAEASPNFRLRPPIEGEGIVAERLMARWRLAAGIMVAEAPDVKLEGET